MRPRPERAPCPTTASTAPLCWRLSHCGPFCTSRERGSCGNTHSDLSTPFERWTPTVWLGWPGCRAEPYARNWPESNTRCQSSAASRQTRRKTELPSALWISWCGGSMDASPMRRPTMRMALAMPSSARPLTSAAAFSATKTLARFPSATCPGRTTPCSMTATTLASGVRGCCCTRKRRR